jgi:hypothetical protein
MKMKKERQEVLSAPVEEEICCTEKNLPVHLGSAAEEVI